MSASQAVHVLVEVHHLEAVELIRDLLDLFLLIRRNKFYALGAPFYVLARRRLVLTTSLDGATGDLSIVDVRDLVV